MIKYLFKRLLHGLFSVVAVVAIVMLLVYSLMDRELVFAADPQFTKVAENQKELYKQRKWEAYGYVDYVPFTEYVASCVASGEITKEQQVEINKLAADASKDTGDSKTYIGKFTELYESKGYSVIRLKATKTQASQLYATKNISVFTRLLKYFTNLITIDNIHYVERNIKDAYGSGVKLENVGLKFTLFDPVYNTTSSGYKLSFSDNGTTKYLSVVVKKGVPALNLTTNESSATTFNWDSRRHIFSYYNGADAYAFGTKEGSTDIVFDNVSNLSNLAKISTTEKTFTIKKDADGNQVYQDGKPVYLVGTGSSQVESVDFEEYFVLERYTNLILFAEIADNYKFFLETKQSDNTIKRDYVVFSNNKFVVSETEASGINLDVDTVLGGQLVKKVFSPAIMGVGTKNKYLLYVDNKFPFIHQNLVSINLGLSYSVRKDIDIFETMFAKQDPVEYHLVTFPTGLTEISPDNLHTTTYSYNSRDVLITNSQRFTDDYTQDSYFRTNMPKTGFSFVIGIIATIISYVLGVPLGIIMARQKDKFVDKLGTIYIIFIIAVPSLAYILMFRTIGQNVFGLPNSFDLTKITTGMYVLPIVSLALPSIAGLMKWIRRYMIDQMNSDYVKFARSGGLSEKEIFSKHILKNAIIPIVHGIPGSILGAIVGAIITESIYLVPGAGYLLTTAINRYDNSVIVGLTLFYSLLSIVSLILGDILMSLVDPRISFVDKAR